MKALQKLSVYTSLLVFGSAIGFIGHSYLNNSQSITQQQPELIPTRVTSYSTIPIPEEKDPEELNFIAQAVQKVGPSVVRIDSSRTVSQGLGTPLDPLRRFFGNGGNGNEVPNEERALEKGTGSGFIFSNDGVIITNAHVVDGTDKVTVTLKDGQIYLGKVIGTDPLTDIAIVKIDANNLPTVKLGKSHNLIPGEWAIAIGNPLGLDNTVTVGIVSALERSSAEVGIPGKRVRFIQTDAAINPGNSGGPLLNAQGEVIGMNTAIRANAQGLGFAIPVETVQKIADELYTFGEAQHPYLGIQMITINTNTIPSIKAETGLDLTGETGVIIIEVIPNSPADQAGLERGDILKTVGGKPIATATEVQEEVEESRIGEELAVDIKRDGIIKTITVTPGSFPQE